YDTVSVYVTENRIDANEIKLVVIDSTRTGGYGTGGLPRVRVDLYKNGSLVEKGSSIPLQVDLPVTAIPDNTGGPDAEPVYRIRNDKLFIGYFWVRSSLNLYGNEVRDSVRFQGLHNDQGFPAPTFYDVSDPNKPTLLDTLAIMNYQLCAVVMVM